MVMSVIALSEELHSDSHPSFEQKCMSRGWRDGSALPSMLGNTAWHLSMTFGDCFKHGQSRSL